MPNRFFLITCMAAALSAQTPQDDKRLIFSTYLGGGRTDDAVAVAVDAAGSTYVAGKSDSGDFSGKGFGNINLSYALPRAYLTKYSPDGKEIVWSHIIGGSANTRANAVAVDREGNVYLAGTTGARDFPLMKPVQDKQTGLNIAFVMKFDPEGKLLFSTYLGGDRNEEGLAVAADSQGNIYLAGRASSTNFPVKDAMQPKQAGGGQDAFIAKFTAGYQLAWATYFGGTAGTDNIHGIAIGPDDALFVTGDSMSPGLATENAWLRLPPPYSSFAAKIDPSGQSVHWLSYVGHRSGYSRAQTIAVDAQGRAWVGGYTNAKSWPMTEDAIQPKYAGGHRDGFLMRFSADGTAAEYITYLGGSFTGDRDPDDTVESVQVDARGHVYVTGETISTDFPSYRAVQKISGGSAESYLMRFDPANRQIVSSTFWGGSKRDSGAALALGPGENVTLVGETYSDNLPLLNAARKQLGPSTDAFVARICDPWLNPWPSASLGFSYVLGSAELPAVQNIEVLTGCTAPHEVAEVTADQPWLKFHADGRTAPLKLAVEVNTADLAPGEYSAQIRVKVPSAVHPELTIPVTFTVVEPPPPPPVE